MKSISLPWNRMSYHLSGFQKLHKKGNKMVSFSVCLVVPYHPYPHCHFLKQDKNRFNLLGTLVFKCSMDPICAIAVIQDLSFFATTGYPIWLWLSTRSFPILFFLSPFHIPSLLNFTNRKTKPEANKSGGWWARNWARETPQPNGALELCSVPDCISIPKDSMLCKTDGITPKALGN